MNRFLLGALAGLAVGLLAARLPSPRPAGSPAPRAQAAPALCVATVRREDLEGLRDEILADLHEHAAVATAGATAVTKAPAQPDPGPSPEAIQAEQAAGELLARALAAGSWSRRDALAYQRYVAAMPNDERQGAMSAVAMAVNDQKLKLEPPGGP